MLAVYLFRKRLIIIYITFQVKITASDWSRSNHVVCDILQYDPIKFVMNVCLCFMIIYYSPFIEFNLFFLIDRIQRKFVVREVDEEASVLRVDATEFQTDSLWQGVTGESRRGATLLTTWGGTNSVSCSLVESARTWDGTAFEALF